jgi:predicted membrane protein
MIDDNDDVPLVIPAVSPEPVPTKGPIEAKVTAATGGSAIGVALAGLVMWLLDTYAFTTSSVPDAITAVVWAVIPVGLTFLGGFSAKHTFRNDAQAMQGGTHD